MNKILRRLHSKAGESLIESMAAILIFTMGSIIMLSMVSTAADINTKAKAADISYNKQIVAAEMTSDDARVAGDCIATISISKGGSTISETIPVEIFCHPEETDPLYTFYETGGSGK